MNLGTGLLSGAFVVDEGALDGSKDVFSGFSREIF